jgi:hypothetical protein
MHCKDVTVAEEEVACFVDTQKTSSQANTTFVPTPTPLLHQPITNGGVPHPVPSVFRAPPGLQNLDPIDNFGRLSVTPTLSVSSSASTSLPLPLRPFLPPLSGLNEREVADRRMRILDAVDAYRRRNLDSMSWCETTRTITDKQVEFLQEIFSVLCREE